MIDQVPQSRGAASVGSEDQSRQVFEVRFVEFFSLLRGLMLLVVVLLAGMSGYWLVKALTG